MISLLNVSYLDITATAITVAGAVAVAVTSKSTAATAAVPRRQMLIA